MQALWHAPVALEDVGEDGRHLDLVADKDVRAAVAAVAGLRDLPRLEATFDLTRHGADGLRVTGRVLATVGQNCVVTLEPLSNEIDEAVDLVFAPPRLADENGEAAAPPGAKAEKPASAQVRNGPEPLIGGAVDLGALAIEFLILGVNPYPRKPGAVFQPPQDVEPDPRPFAALAGLTKGRDGA